MRKVLATAFVSLDGVMQAPGGPEEDPPGGFRFGGWTFPYGDDVVWSVMGGIFSTPYELPLGRKTYEIFAAHWPHVTRADRLEELDRDPRRAEGHRAAQERRRPDLDDPGQQRSDPDIAEA